MTLTTPQQFAPTVERRQAERPRARPSQGQSTLAQPRPLPTAYGPVSAAIRVIISVSPDRPRVIVSLVGQIDRAVIASSDLLCDLDLMLAEHMLDGLDEGLWADVDPRWAADAELREAHSTLRSAMRDERDRASR